MADEKVIVPTEEELAAFEEKMNLPAHPRNLEEIEENQ